MKAARDSKRPPPPKFIEIDQITENWMSFFLTSFYHLSTERPVGMGVGPIPWSKIIQYGEYYGFHGSSLDAFYGIIS